jgi:adenylate cyclase
MVGPEPVAAAIAPSGDDALPAAQPGWSNDPIATWLVEHGGRSPGPETVLAELCERLLGAGVPLLRVVIGVRSTHPEIAARSFVWQRGGEGALGRDFTYTSRDKGVYLRSPVRLIHEGASAIRRRLEGPDAARDFPVLDDLAAMGATDYVIMPIVQTDGRVNFISWTTDRKGGFDTAELALLYDLLPLIALRTEIGTAHADTRTLLETYLGREPARRVLNGRVRRGQVETIRAVVLVSDVRGFTALSDRIEPAQVVALLDSYFEVAARPIEEREGEILKFIGDGLLAIFSVGDHGRQVCNTALEAAFGIIDGLDRLNIERAGKSLPEIRCGVGLHVGDVQYGNVGARDRLDFTVVGRAVNEASRVENLCKALDRRILATAVFARLARNPALFSVGFHALRGVREPQEIFGVLR